MNDKTVGEVVQIDSTRAEYQQELNVAVNENITVDRLKGEIQNIMTYEWVTAIEPYMQASMGSPPHARSHYDILMLRIRTVKGEDNDIITWMESLGALDIFSIVSPNMRLIPINAIELMELENVYTKTR